MQRNKLLAERKQGAEILVYACANLKSHEKALIISDTTTANIGDELKKTAERICPQIKHIIIEPFKVHAEEPPEDVAAEMLHNDVIFGLTKMSMAHTLACQKASSRKARYLSLPDYNFDLLCSESLQVDFKKIALTVDRVAKILDKGKKMVITSDKGTQLYADLTGRRGNPAPGFCSEMINLASPPDIEANIAPVEDQSEGVLVVDGSIPCQEIGLLHSDVRLEIKGGRIAKITGEVANILNDLLNRFPYSKTSVLAEIGFGLNPKAKLTGHMLEDEGCLGTVHFGFGSNTALGGMNQVPFHLDMIVQNLTVCVDQQFILKKGILVI